MARQKTAQSQSVRTTLSGVVREDVLAKLRVSFETYSILDAVDEVDGSHIRENARIKVRSHCCDCMAADHSKASGAAVSISRNNRLNRRERTRADRKKLGLQ